MKNLLKALKVISIMLTAVIVFTAGSCLIMAKHEVTVGEAQNGIYATFDPIKTDGTWDGGKPREAGKDGKSLVLKENEAGNIMGFYAKGIKEGVYKVGYYLTLDTVEESDKRVRFKPLGEDLYFNIPYSELQDYEGEKILVVTLVRVEENRDSLHIGLWKDLGISGTLDKIVIAASDYNFIAGSPDYELIAEDLPQDTEQSARDRDYEHPNEDEWVPSDEAPNPNVTSTPAVTQTPGNVTQTPEGTVPDTTATPTPTSPAATKTPTAMPVPGNDEGSAFWLIIVIIVVLGGIGAVVYYVMKNKK